MVFNLPFPKLSSITLSLVITVTIFPSGLKLQYSDTSGAVLAEEQPYYIVYTMHHQLKTDYEHLQWLKIDLNAAEIITVQDLKRRNN